MLYSVAAFITIIGVAFLIAVVIYGKKLKKFISLLNLLLQNNTIEDIDTTLKNIEEILKKGGIEALCYDLRYLQTHLQRSCKVKKSKEIKKEISTSMLQGYVAIVPKNNKGENRVLNTLLLHIVTLLISNTIQAQINAQNRSFEHIAKLQTYMMHDLKNILQFFQAMQYNIDTVSTDEEALRLVEFLKTSTKPIDKKVARILALLKTKSFHLDAPKEMLDIKEILLEYAHHYNLECIIKGEASLYIERELFRSVIENILKNIYDKRFTEPDIICYANVVEDESSVTIDIWDSCSPFEQIEKLFEPFWSSKEEGLGIGLYQVKYLIEQAKGDIKAKNIKEHPHILISLPKS